MKYIVMQTDDGMKLPFIFSEKLIHEEMARLATIVIMRQLQQVFAKAVSAGFVNINDCRTFGESETLRGMKPASADAARMIIGSSIEFMPDESVLAVLAKAGKELKAK